MTKHTVPTLLFTCILSCPNIHAGKSDLKRKRTPIKLSSPKSWGKKRKGKAPGNEKKENPKELKIIDTEIEETQPKITKFPTPPLPLKKVKRLGEKQYSSRTFFAKKWSEQKIESIKEKEKEIEKQKEEVEKRRCTLKKLKKGLETQKLKYNFKTWLLTGEKSTEELKRLIIENPILGEEIEYLDISKEKNIEFCKFLMLVWKINGLDYRQIDILHYAAQHWNPKDLHELIEKELISDLNKVNLGKQTPLHKTALHTNKYLGFLNAATLLQAGAQVHVDNATSPLKAALRKQHYKLADLLIRYGAFYETVQPKRGKIWLTGAAIENQTAVVTFLLDRGIKLDNEHLEKVCLEGLANNNRDALRIIFAKNMQVLPSIIKKIERKSTKSEYHKNYVQWLKNFSSTTKSYKGNKDAFKTL